MYRGKVSGLTLAIMKTSGRNTFTVERPSDYATGIFKIIFDTPMPDDDYVINVSVQRWAIFAIVWNTRPPTVNGFHIVIYTTANALTDAIFHFNVM